MLMIPCSPPRPGGAALRGGSRGRTAAGVLLLAAGVAFAQASSLAAAPVAPSPAPLSLTSPPTNTMGLKALEDRIRVILDKVSPAVISVGGGSGVVVSEDGYALTVAHVNQRAGRDVTVVFPDGRRARAKTLGNDAGVDAGLMKIIDKGPWPHVEMGKSADLKLGQWCLALGYPVSFERGRSPPVRLGRVLQNTLTVVTTDCTIMGGDSGGPLFDLDGKVIGVNSRCNNSLAQNMHVPVDCYRSNWERFAKGEDVGNRNPRVAILGVMPDNSTTEAKIGLVVEGSGAEKAGLKAGDIVVKFDGQEVLKYSTFADLIRARKPGDKVRLEVRRGSDTLTLEATLGQSGR
jgi:serine protease Do